MFSFVYSISVISSSLLMVHTLNKVLMIVISITVSSIFIHVSLLEEVQKKTKILKAQLTLLICS